MSIIAFTNQKGGVGKTSLCWNCGVFLSAKYGKKILIVDLDTQGTISTILTCGHDDNEQFKQIIDFKGLSTKALFNNLSLDNINILKSSHNIDLIYNKTYTVSLLQYMRQAPSEDDKTELYIKYFINNLKAIAKNYDYVLLDCPPAYGDYITAAILESDYVIAPIKPLNVIMYGLDSLYNLLSVHQKENKFLGMVLNNVNKSWSKDLEYVEQARDNYKHFIFDSTIYQRSPFQYAVDFNIPLYSYPQWRTSAQEIDALVHEIVARIDAKEGTTTNLTSII